MFLTCLGNRLLFFLIKCWHIRIYSRRKHFGGYGAACLALWFFVVFSQHIFSISLACTVLHFASAYLFKLFLCFCLNDNLFTISGVLWSSYMGLTSTGIVAGLNLNSVSFRLVLLWEFNAWIFLILGVIWELVFSWSKSLISILREFLNPNENVLLVLTYNWDLGVLNFTTTPSPTTVLHAITTVMPSLPWPLLPPLQPQCYCCCHHHWLLDATSSPSPLLHQPLPQILLTLSLKQALLPHCHHHLHHCPYLHFCLHSHYLNNHCMLLLAPSPLLYQKPKHVPTQNHYLNSLNFSGLILQARKMDPVVYYF